VRGSCRIGVLLAASVVLAPALTAPGSAAAQSAFLYMGSQRGEYIGQGGEWRYTQEDASFQVHYGRLGDDPFALSIEVDNASDGRNPWNVLLAAPGGRALTPGRYVDAQRTPFRDPGYPGLDVSGDARGCNVIDGWFDVSEAEFTPSGDVIRFAAAFVQYCDGHLTALYGAVGIGVPAPASFPKPPAPVAASLSFRSEPGDYVGQGQRLRYTNGRDSVFHARRGPLGVSVTVLPYAGPVWTVRLAAPGHRPPSPGVYEGAMRNPFEAPGAPGLDFSGDGRGCNKLSGRFTVSKARYGPQGLIRHLRANFEQHCEGAAPALRGEVRVAFPQPAVRAALRVIPTPPVAGRRFTVRLAVRDRGIRVRGVRCAASVEGRRAVRTRRAASRRGAVCAWRLPSSARGKRVRGYVRVRAGGSIVTRRFRVRATSPAAAP
jgi:hypothetical protein